MNDKLRVMYATKTTQVGRRDVVRSIGGIDAGGLPWSLRAADAIREIESGQRSFYVRTTGGTSVNVVVGLHLKTRYLTTEADRFEPAHLIELPDFPYRSADGQFPPATIQHQRLDSRRETTLSANPMRRRMGS